VPALRLPDAVPRAIEAWLLPLDLDAPVAKADWKLLDDGEKARARRLHRHADRVRMVSTRAALRQLLGARLQREPASLCFESGPNRKPRLKQQHALAFNVSHSGSYALIAVGASPDIASVGVDIERHDPGIELDALAEYAFTPAERASLDTRSDRAPAFFDRWVAKEAVLKAVGVGIGEHLQQVSVHQYADGRLQVEHEMDAWLPLCGYRLDAPQNYSAAIAWQAAGHG